MTGPDDGPDHADPRAVELRARLDAVEERVRAACAAAGRERSDVRLIVVTKTHPAADVRRLAGLGVRDVGENRDQEAAEKAAELAGGPDPVAGLRWHFVGQLQRNKVASVVRYAAAVHSVDRSRLVTALADAVERADRDLDVLLQVDLGGGAQRPGAPRGGVDPADLPPD
ncbi:alanine racemase, partial [Angustibacter aerolatus]